GRPHPRRRHGRRGRRLAAGAGSLSRPLAQQGRAMSAALACHGLESGYGDTAVLRDVALGIAAGEIYALIGKNGAGKSTFLKTLIGPIARRRGFVALLDRDVAGWPTNQS